ncbi:MAG: hypothetical protein HY692_07130 [Cyanobacteria bacterium NC_groundwater_1444_Ag_S-0.65um_54_12]|nr:hypothetical protein [Cyanobacteria bacterium NC_groundwater_1444_Ag_S-0.65um_54_12]
MVTTTALPREVIMRKYGQLAWVNSCLVQLAEDHFAEVTLALASTRPANWMDVLDERSKVVFEQTAYRTIFSCFASGSTEDLLA